MEPGGEGGGIADRARAAGEHEEGSLERVVGVLDVAEHVPADAQHEPAVPPHQRRERRRVAGPPVPLQQLRVGDVRARPGQAAEVAEHGASGRGRHTEVLRPGGLGIL